MTGEHSTVVRNALSGYGLRGLRVVTVLLLTPYLFRKLGLGGFGTWSVMFTVTTILGVLELGLAAGLTKFVAEFRAKGEREQLDALVGAGVVLAVGAGIAALCASILVGIFADGLAAAGQEDAFRTGMFFLGGGMFVKFTSDAYWGALTGYQSFVRANVATAVSIVGFPLGCVVALETGGGVVDVAISYAITLAATGVVSVVLLHRLDPDLSLRPRRPAELGRMLATFSSLSLLVESMRLIGERMDTIVIAAIRNAAAAAPFAAASKLLSGLQSLTFPFLVLLMPMTSDLWARGLRDEVTKRFFLATRVALQVGLPVAAGLALFSNDIVQVWLGPSAPDVTASIIVVLMAAESLGLAAAAAEGVLIGIGRIRAVGLLALVQGLTNLGLSIVLVSSHGAIGAAVSTLVTTAMLSQLVLPIACRALGSPLSSLLRTSFVPALLSVIPPVALMVAVRLAMSPGIGRLAAGLGLGLAAAAGVGVSQIGLGRVRTELKSLTTSIGRSPQDERLLLEGTQADSG